MITIFDLSKAFLSIESMTNKKLQKLCYYAKAWYLALYDEELISEPFEAWVHGPVNPALYDKYKEYGGDLITEDVSADEVMADLLGYAKQVYASYGHMDGDELEIVSHGEEPWIEARGDKRPWEPCNTAISESTMNKFYKRMNARECAARQVSA